MANYDLLVIGTDSAGQHAAGQTATLGKTADRIEYFIDTGFNDPTLDGINQLPRPWPPTP